MPSRKSREKKAARSALKLQEYNRMKNSRLEVVDDGALRELQPDGGEDIEEEEEEVCFCLVELNWPKARPTGCPSHFFHAECLIRWALREDKAVANKKTCPLCRTEFEDIIMEAFIGAPEEVIRPENVFREQSLGGGIPAPVPASPEEYISEHQLR